MDHEHAVALAEGFLAAWNSQDVDRLLGCYTPDVRYRDPNTAGFVEGHEALGRYLTQLFDNWEMHWSLREAYPLRDVEGAGALWRATLRPTGGERSVEVEGMDLALLDGDRLSRNDVYFDRAALAPLFAGSVAGASGAVR
jgi:ketosteroid isomerase-like protein